MRSPLPLLAVTVCLGILGTVAVAGEKSDDTAVATTSASIRMEGPIRVVSVDEAELRVPLGGDVVCLFVRQADSAHPSRIDTVYSGPNLASIVAANASLESSDAISALTGALDTLPKAAAPSNTEAPWRVAFVDGPVRYETWRGATSALLHVTRDGTTTAYRGRDLAEILANHAELKELDEVHRLRSRVDALGTLRLRTQPWANRIERPAWLDMTLRPDGTDVVVREKQTDGSWTKHMWSGKDYQAIAQTEADFRARAPLWFDVDFGSSVADLPMRPTTSERRD